MSAAGVTTYQCRMKLKDPLYIYLFIYLFIYTHTLRGTEVSQSV